MLAQEICNLFERTFGTEYSVRIEGGASEPLYEPASGELKAVIYFRDDYASSALHEIAHWCIAGKDRLAQVDYGYWYEPARDAHAQRQFELAEAKPQALEWILSVASATEFRVSYDNFIEAPSSSLKQAVQKEVTNYLRAGLPPRADEFVNALVRVTHQSDALNVDRYEELPR